MLDFGMGSAIGGSLLLPKPFSLRHSQTIHQYLANERIIFLYGAIMGYPQRVDSFNASQVADTILVLNKLDKTKPIWLVIDSEGGFVSDGLIIYDTIRSIEAPVYTVGRSCFSMAAVLLTVGEKGHRYLYPHAKVMLHLPQGETSGDSEQVKIQAKELDKVKDVLVDILIENGVTKPRKKILFDINREHWMTSKEAIDYGLADHILPNGLL